MLFVHFHNQLPAVLLTILLSALATIFATLPNPVAAASGFAKALAMAVPDPGLALPGRISAVMFSLVVHVQNEALPSFTRYIQIVLGIFSAIAQSG